MMKEHVKKIIVRLLWLQVRRLRQKHDPLVIAVAGSVGKTGTKTAIATVLSQHMNVAWQTGNYNDIISVPLVFFGYNMPHLLNPFGWVWILLRMEASIHSKYPYEAVVIELGVDRPGDMEQFYRYVRVDYGVLTAISPEHMLNFKDVAAVAKEEMEIARLANQVLVDVDAVDEKYHRYLAGVLTYGRGTADCRYDPKPLTEKLKRPVAFTLKNNEKYQLEARLIGKQSLPALAAAVLLASQLKLTKEEIQKGLTHIRPVAGRMQPFKGLHGSLVIDDTYNASPEAVKAALACLYEVPATQKIAVLGQMNELGKHSKQLHEEIGDLCDPKQLEVVVTIGKDANEYLAAVAEKRGCRVVRCLTPYHAADIVRPILREGAVVLVKGSQNGVFAEETVKNLLYDPSDAKKLVRQSRYWLKVKENRPWE